MKTSHTNKVRYICIKPDESCYIIENIEGVFIDNRDKYYEIGREVKLKTVVVPVENKTRSYEDNEK